MVPGFSAFFIGSVFDCGRGFDDIFVLDNLHFQKNFDYIKIVILLFGLRHFKYR